MCEDDGSASTSVAFVWRGQQLLQRRPIVVDFHTCDERLPVKIADRSLGAVVRVFIRVENLLELNPEGVSYDRAVSVVLGCSTRQASNGT